MAVAKVTLVCPTCGAEFTKTKTCYNRKEADRWEEYMKDAEIECPECYKARRNAAAAEIVARFGMPEITGVSEKQIKFANDLRNDFLLGLDVERSEKAYKAFSGLVVSDRWEKMIGRAVETYADVAAALHEELGMAVEVTVKENGKKHREMLWDQSASLESLIVLMATGEARAIIDWLKEINCMDCNEKTLVAAVDTIVAKIKEEAAKAETTATEEGNDNNATEETATATEAKKPTYDKSAIMRSAWAKKKSAGDKKTFGECLQEAWAEAKKAAGVETTATKRTRRSAKTANAMYAY